MTAALLGVVGSASGEPQAAPAPATSPKEAVAAVNRRITESTQTVAAASKQEAVDALAAARKAADAASAASEAATALNAAIGTTNLASIKTLSAAAAKASAAAADAAGTARSAAATAAKLLVADPAKPTAEHPAKSRADAGVTEAVVAATAAAAASAAAAAANTTVAAAADLPPAQKAGGTLVAETNKAAVAAANAAAGAATAAEEAAKPSLPVMTEEDRDLLAALRARITGGAIFSNGAPTLVYNADRTAASFQSNQFGQAATYLAFEAQPRLWAFDWWGCGDDPVCRDSRRRVSIERGYLRYYVDPFVNVRLTTIPVAGAATTTVTTSAAAPQASAIQSPGPAFLQSQKAVQVQLGAMAGVNFGRFGVRQSQFHWGFGPVFRYMWQNVTDSQRAIRPWDIENDLFKNWSAGGRLTLYQLDQAVGSDPRDGWAPAAYLDGSIGRFENFQTVTGGSDAAVTCIRDIPRCLAAGVPQSDDFTVSDDVRVYIEGRVFMRYIYLGMDLNTGPGADDLRFIAGLTMSLNQFFARRE